MNLLKVPAVIFYEFFILLVDYFIIEIVQKRMVETLFTGDMLLFATVSVWFVIILITIVGPIIFLTSED